MTATTANVINLAADDRTATALVATIRAAVNGAGKYAAYVADHDVTRETVKHHARALAEFAYPNETPVQTKDGVRTKFGNAVQAAGNGLRAALDTDDTAKGEPDWLALAVQAVKNAAEHDVAPDDIAKAVLAVLPIAEGTPVK